MNSIARPWRAALVQRVDSTGGDIRIRRDEIRTLLTKNKVGRRAVHHILTASERKAFKIAKQTAHLVRSSGTRMQPLADTYYKYCQALNWPYIFIHREEHGSGNENRVTIDLRTLGLSRCHLEQIRSLVVATLGPLNDECWTRTLETASQVFDPPAVEAQTQARDGDDDDDSQVFLNLRGMLRFQGTFGETKTMCCTSLDICRSFLADNGIELSKPWWTR